MSVPKRERPTGNGVQVVPVGPTREIKDLVQLNRTNNLKVNKTVALVDPGEYTYFGDINMEGIYVDAADPANKPLVYLSNQTHIFGVGTTLRNLKFRNGPNHHGAMLNSKGGFVQILDCDFIGDGMSDELGGRQVAYMMHGDMGRISDCTFKDIRAKCIYAANWQPYENMRDATINDNTFTDCHGVIQFNPHYVDEPHNFSLTGNMEVAGNKAIRCGWRVPENRSTGVSNQAMVGIGAQAPAQLTGKLDIHHNICEDGWIGMYTFGTGNCEVTFHHNTSVRNRGFGHRFYRGSPFGKLTTFHDNVAIDSVRGSQSDFHIDRGSGPLIHFNNSWNNQIPTPKPEPVPDPTPVPTPDPTPEPLPTDSPSMAEFKVLQNQMNLLSAEVEQQKLKLNEIKNAWMK